MIDIQPALNVYHGRLQFTHGDTEPGKIWGGDGATKKGDFKLEEGESVTGVDIKKGSHDGHTVRGLQYVIIRINKTIRSVSKGNSHDSISELFHKDNILMKYYLLTIEMYCGWFSAPQKTHKTNVLIRCRNK